MEHGQGSIYYRDRRLCRVLLRQGNVAGGQRRVSPSCAAGEGWPAIPPGKKVTFDFFYRDKGLHSRPQANQTPGNPE